MAQKLYFLFCLLVTFFIENKCSQQIPRNGTKAMFYNPISDVGYWDDPDAYLHTDGFYYLPGFNPNTKQLSLYRSRKLSNLRQGEVVDIFRAGSEFYVYEPEIYFLDGEFYIYIGYPDGFYLDHKIFVMKANNPNNPMGGWSTPYKLPLPAPNSLFEYGGTVLNYGNGRRYFIWVGQATGVAGTRIFISAMCSPMLICGNRFLLKEIDFPWEHDEFDRGYLSGAHVLQNAGRTFVIYSANTASTEDVVFGIMGIDDLKDPLDYYNWWRHDQPVFTKNVEENVFALGTASFTVSPDGTESWMVYSGRNRANGMWADQTMRTQKFTWNLDGTPNFGTAIGLQTPLEAPSGE